MTKDEILTYLRAQKKAMMAEAHTNSYRWGYMDAIDYAVRLVEQMEE